MRTKLPTLSAAIDLSRQHTKLRVRAGQGIILPSKQQVQARFRRYHIADGDDSVRVSKKSSKVLTRFSSDLWAAEAMLAARANAHIWFGTEKVSTPVLT